MLGLEYERLINRDDLAYYLEWHELFARSYAQFIALTSDSREMRLQIGAFSDSKYRELLYPIQ